MDEFNWKRQRLRQLMCVGKPISDQHLREALNSQTCSRCYRLMMTNHTKESCDAEVAEMVALRLRGVGPSRKWPVR